MEEYTIKEAATILDVSTSTIRRRIKSGKLNAEKKDSPYGKQYFISEEEFEQAIAKNEIMEIKNIDKPVAPEVITNRIIKALETKNRDIIENVLDNKVEELKKHNEDVIKKEAENIATEINDHLDKQQEINEQLLEKIRHLQKEKNKSLIDKIKNFFNLYFKKF
jgi:excisionase family DNA binding protein